MISNSIKIGVFSGLFGFVISFLLLSIIFRWRRRREGKYDTNSLKISTQHDESLHWDPLEERRGLGNLLIKANHIAITVSDVGRSLNFYIDVLGLQQIRRPTFDRHGAWLTMGNIELHLIKGIPSVPPVDNLQVGHIAFETSHVNEVVCRLRQLNINVRQSLSVTNANKSESKANSSVIQYFFTDPDGYYLELCNCDILTEFALKKESTIDHIDYYEGVSIYEKFDISQVVSHWKQKVEKHRTENLDNILQKIPRASKIDEKKFDNLIKRRLIYGDIIQGFSDEDIKETLLATHNFVPLTVKILTQKRGENKFFQASSFLENGQQTKPEPFIMNENDSN